MIQLSQNISSDESEKAERRERGGNCVVPHGYSQFYTI